MSRTLEQIQAEKRRLQRQLLEKKELLRLYREQNRCFFVRPYRWQERFRKLVTEKNVTIVAAPNKIGKSGWLANLGISWAMGFEPWAEVQAGTPGAVEHGGKWYRASSLGLKPPVRLRITGEDWTVHMAQTIIPELTKWAPKGWYETKKNQLGVDAFWTWKNGSTFEMLVYSQSEATTESWLGDGWLADEPPPQRMYGSMSRGLFLRKGKVAFGMTPLKEVWVLDELILSGRSDVGVIDDLLITDNEELYDDECARLREMGLSAEQVERYFDLLLFRDKPKGLFVEDKGRAAKQFALGAALPAAAAGIDELKLMRFVQDTDPKEAPSRFGGKFKALIGRVLKSWKQDRHWIEPFPVPTDWPVLVMIDFHLSKPQAISFHAVNRQGMKFVIHEIWDHMTPEETADAIIRFVRGNGLRCERAQIDPLSKGDTAYVRQRMGQDLEDSFSIIERRLAEHDIVLEVASKDKDSGIRNIERDLMGVNGIPTYYVFNTCPRHLAEVQRWVYDDDGKPAKEFDDMMENWYRATLAGLEWEDSRPRALPSGPPRSEHAWMGA